MIYKFKFISILCLFYISVCSYSQTDTSSNNQTSQFPNIDFYRYRGANVLDIGLGTSIMNGDFTHPILEIYSHVGYKRFIKPYLNINVGYNKFNLAYRNIFNNGYMSFDLNVETVIFPNNRFSPYAFAGAGVHASNYFKQVDSKLQGGLGIEYIVFENLGVKLFSDYNHVFSDEVDGKIFGASDDIYWRIACGVNYYFGGKKQLEKLLKRYPSVIKTNQL